jgi:hypothetical protein
MGFPPEPQELRRKIGRAVVSTTTDRPWSQYFCCLIIPTARSYASTLRHQARAPGPLQGQRDVRARAGSHRAAHGGPRLHGQLRPGAEVVKEMPYGQWRQYDAQDTVRFFALRLREVGMLSAPVVEVQRAPKYEVPNHQPEDKKEEGEEEEEARRLSVAVRSRSCCTQLPQGVLSHRST